MGEIQRNKLTPGQRAIVREVQAKQRNEENKVSPLPKKLIKEITIIKDPPIIDELDIIKHENHIRHENQFRHENIISDNHKFIETSMPTLEISNPIVEPKNTPHLLAVIDGIIHSKILGFQKELLRGDINIAEFVSLLEGLDYSMDFVEDKLDHVRMSMHEYFGLDMDMVRI